jgi:hypothetical protein
MSLSNYTRSARTALTALVARAPQKEISFAEAVSAQTTHGEGAE